MYNIYRMLLLSFEESQNETHPPPQSPSIGEGYSAHTPLNAIWKTLPGKSLEISLCIFSSILNC